MSSPAPAFVALGIIVVVLVLPFLDNTQIPPVVQMLGSGLAAALFSQAVVWWKESARDQRNADRDQRFIALQLAVVLERYAIECAMRIGEIDQKLDESYIYGAQSAALPGMPPLELPNAVEWRWIDSAVTSDVLSLTPRIKFGEGSIAATFDFGNWHDGAEEIKRQLLLIGRDAWDLACKVRAKYKLPVQTYPMGDWDFVKALQGTQ